MIEKVALLIVLPVALIYMSIIVRQKSYAVTGMLLFVLMAFMAFSETAIFSFLRKNYFPLVTNKMIFYLMTAITAIFALVLIIYNLRKEAEAKKAGSPINMGKDFRKILKPEKRNLIFWVVVISYYIGMKIYLGGID